MTVNGVAAGPRDGIAITGEARLEVVAGPLATWNWCWSTRADITPALEDGGEAGQ